MPTASRDDEWERLKLTVWTMCVCDKLEYRMVLEKLKNDFGFHTSMTELKARLSSWNFQKNISQSVGKYVHSQVAKRKSQNLHSDVIIYGARVPPAKIAKLIGRNYESLTNILLNTCGSSSFVSGTAIVCDPAKFSLEGQKWSHPQPWLRFSEDVPFLNAILSNFIQDDPVQGNKDLLSLLRQDSNVSEWASPSRIAAQLSAQMLERFDGELLIFGQALAGYHSGSATPVLFALCAYRISNGHSVQDEVLLKLIDQMDLLRTLRIRRGDARLGGLTMPILLRELFGVAVRHLRLDLLKWLLDLGVNPDTRIKRKYEDLRRDLRRPLSVLLDRRDRLPRSANREAEQSSERNVNEVGERPDCLRLMEILVTHGAEMQDAHCGNNDNPVELAAGYRDTDALSLFAKHGGPKFAATLDWATLFCRATGTSTAYSEAEMNILGQQLLCRLIEWYSSIYPDATNPFEQLMSPEGLIKAAEEGGVVLLRMLRNHGADFNCDNGKGKFPLGATTTTNNGFWICKALLDLGANPSYCPVGTVIGVSVRYPSALHAATREDRKDICRLLLERGANPKQLTDFYYRPWPNRTLYLSQVPMTPLQWTGTFDCAMLLLKGGATLQGDELLRAVENTYWASPEYIRELIARGVDIDHVSANGETAVQIALRRGGHKWVGALVDAGAQMDKRFGYLCATSVVFNWRDSNFDMDVLKASMDKYGLETENDMANWLLVSLAKVWAVDDMRGDRIEIALSTVLERFPRAYSFDALCSVRQGLWDECLDHQSEVLIAKEIVKRRPTRHSNSRHVAAFIEVAVMTAVMHGDMCLLDELLTQLEEQEDTTHTLSDLESWESPFGIMYDWGRDNNDEPYPSRRTAVTQRLLHAGLMPCTLDGLLAISSRVSLEEIKTLINSQGFDPRRRYPWYPTALQLAAANEDLKLIELLLQAGVNVNACPPWTRQPHKLHNTRPYKLRYHVWGWRQDRELSRTALQMAAETGNLDIIQTLIRHGANVNAPPARIGGATALQLASMQGHVGIVQWLLDKGALPNAEAAEIHGRTAFEGAAEYGRVDTIEVLLRADCDVFEDGRLQFIRAVNLARQNHHPELAEHLQSFGGETDETSSTVSDCPECPTRKYKMIHDIHSLGFLNLGQRCDDTSSVDDRVTEENHHLHDGVSLDQSMCMDEDSAESDDTQYDYEESESWWVKSPNLGKFAYSSILTQNAPHQRVYTNSD